ncbi:MAG: hypothetical protein E7240_06380 [Lachnospiraceae bacterium]|nr:hypothetical protein [Lachnospiraceae bacterium]
MRIKIFLVTAVLIVLFVFIFATDTIRVTGNEHMSGQEIRTMIEEQPVSFNTALLYLYNLVRPIEDRNFIDRVKIRLANPRTVVAEVREKQFAGYIEANGKYWYFDRSGVIEACADTPETSLEEGKQYIPLIGGLTAGAPAIGDSMPAADTDFYERLGNLQTVLSRERMIPDTIYVDEEYDVYLTYGSVTVEMGKLDYLEIRMRTLADILPNTEGLDGTLLLSEYEGGEDGVVFRKREKASVAPETPDIEPAAPGEESAEDGSGSERAPETEQDPSEEGNTPSGGTENPPEDEEEASEDGEEEG